VADSVVFVVPHADDESLFAGELLDHYVRAAARVTIVYTTTSSGGAAQARYPGYRAARAAVRAAVFGRLGSVEVTVAPIPDGGGPGRESGALRRQQVSRFLHEPDVIPRGALIFVIGGAGNSDHYIAFQEATSLAWSRGQPVYVYWGYGRDPSRLDPYRAGRTVDFHATPNDRSFKVWAIRQYEVGVYDGGPYRRFLPRIMESAAGDDVVTELAPGASLAQLDQSRPDRRSDIVSGRLGQLGYAVFQRIGAIVGRPIGPASKGNGATAFSRR
jgi:LmbE family N-acetylglucosaminyl deacetylase